MASRRHPFCTLFVSSNNFIVCCAARSTSTVRFPRRASSRANPPEWSSWCSARVDASETTGVARSDEIEHAIEAGELEDPLYLGSRANVDHLEGIRDQLRTTACGLVSSISPAPQVCRPYGPVGSAPSPARTNSSISRSGPTCWFEMNARTRRPLSCSTVSMNRCCIAS